MSHGLGQVCYGVFEPEIEMVAEAGRRRLLSHGPLQKFAVP
jgi:hypothetical protein